LFDGSKYLLSLLQTFQIMAKAKKNKDLKRVKKDGVTLISPFQMDNVNHDFITGVQREKRDDTGTKPTIGEVINEIVTEHRKSKTTE
jgi:hypothetical protein